MRAISVAAYHAFRTHSVWKRDNTEVTPEGVWLHGNQIVRRGPDNLVYVTTAGWRTNVTIDRLTPFVEPRSISRRNGRLFVGNREWNGEWAPLQALLAP